MRDKHVPDIFVLLTSNSSIEIHEPTWLNSEGSLDPAGPSRSQQWIYKTDAELYYCALHILEDIYAGVGKISLEALV